VARKLNRENDEKAGQIYQYIVDNHPDDDRAALAGAKIGQIQLRLGNDNAARAFFDNVLSDFSGHPILPKAISMMAAGYWDRALSEPRQNRQTTERAKEYFRKALAKWEIIITQFDEIPFITAHAYHFAGDCYCHFNEYEKAIEYFQSVVSNWPEYRAAWYTQFMVGQSYKRLNLAGAVPISEAEPAIESAFQKLLRDYPDCQAAGAARAWLNYYNNKNKRQSERGPK
jgi:TolA-binding protein